MFQRLGMPAAALACTFTMGCTSDYGNQESVNSRSPLPGLLVLGGSLVLDVAAIIVLMNAQPHLFDAINAYNDDVKDQAAARPAASPADNVAASGR